MVDFGKGIFNQQSTLIYIVAFAVHGCSPPSLCVQAVTGKGRPKFVII